MSPSGPPNPNDGNNSLSSSLRRSNSGYLVSQGSPLTLQMASATATALSRQIQFNGMNMLGNGPNALSRLNQSFGNGGSRVSHRASMSLEAESDPLSNRMAFVSSSFISADAGNNRISNQDQSQSFQSSVGNQMLPDQQEGYQQPQSLDSQSLQHNQQLSLQYFSATHNGHHRDLPQSYQRNRGVFLPVNFEQKSGSDFHGQPFWNDSAKLESHTHSMRGLAPAKAEPHQSDQSLFIQQQQLLHLSMQPPLKTSVTQMDIMNQHRLLQLQEQEQQHLGVIPQQQMSQLHQQFPTQNLSLLDPEKPPYEPGTCARRLTQFMYHQRHRPLDNNIDFWRQFVSEYFAPHAKMKWCLSMYESGRPISHVFRQDVWHCGICNRNPGRGFEATAVVLSRLFKVKYESGTFEELLYVDMPREEHDSASGQTILHCAKATHESVFDQLRVVRDGQLRIVFSADLKICSWEFCTRRHEELIPRGVLLPLVRRLGAAARKYHDASASQKSNPSLSAPKLQSNCNTFVSSARNSAKALDVPLVNDLGYTRRYLRFLQISEVVNSMVDLIDYSRETGTGPMESLVRFPRRTNSSAHRNGPSQHGEDGQPLPQQLQPITTTLRNNDSDQGLQQAASNGALSAGNILSSPTSLNTGPRLLHRNSANSRRQNSLSNGQSSYRAGRHQVFDPSNTLAQVHSTVAPSHTAGAIAPSDNPQPMSSDSVPLPLPAPEADGNESQRSVQNLYRKRRR